MRDAARSDAQSTSCDGWRGGDKVTVMACRLSLLLVLAVGLVAALPGGAAGQARPKVTGKVEVGSIVSATFRGKPSGFRWEGCMTVVALKCTKTTVFGRTQKLTIPAAAAGLQIRASVKVRGRWIASAWSKNVTGAPASSSTAAAPSPGDARTNPVPLGQQAALWDSWTMNVVSYTPDATAVILAASGLNAPPAAGKQFAIVRVRATYTGAGSDTFVATFRLKAIGSSNVELSELNNPCGVVPDRITAFPVVTGGTVEGNVCYEVTASEASTLVLYDDGIYRDSDRRWFALF